MRTNPRFVDAVLGSRWTWPLARLAIVGVFLLAAVSKTVNFSAAVAEQAHFGLHPPELWAAATITVELIGSTLILTNRLVWLGAGMLGVFTALTSVIAHAYWRLPQGPQRFAEFNSFYEHVALIGGFVLVALVAKHSQRTGPA